MSDKKTTIDHFLHDYIKELMSVADVTASDRVQSLWSGYGEIRRYLLSGGNDTTPDSVIVKDINPPESAVHPRGWNTDVSHQRKLRSYEVEAHWYREYVERCDKDCRVAKGYGVTQLGNRQVIVMEDLDSKFPARVPNPGYKRNAHQIKACLQWLAHFQARFFKDASDGLWSTGTYWHLDTRPDELQAMADGKLKQSAVWLDQQLSDCPYQSLVHGDAKIANFCFSPDGLQVAAVDFQYVGRGIGIRDVAYFLGSCMNEQELLEHDKEMLDVYKRELIAAFKAYHPQQPAEDIADTWLSLYAVAWTDFFRFLSGWMPDHPKTHAYTRKLADQVLA